VVAGRKAGAAGCADPGGRRQVLPWSPKPPLRGSDEREVDRYQATSWRSDRVWRSPAAARACRVDGLFFALLKLGQPRVIERALGVRHEHPHFRGAPDMRGSAEEVPDALDQTESGPIT
jgi:hypothetical protein